MRLLHLFQGPRQDEQGLHDRQVHRGAYTPDFPLWYIKIYLLAIELRPSVAVPNQTQRTVLNAMQATHEQMIGTRMQATLACTDARIASTVTTPPCGMHAIAHTGLSPVLLSSCQHSRLAA